MCWFKFHVNQVKFSFFMVKAFTKQISWKKKTLHIKLNETIWLKDAMRESKNKRVAAE